MSNAIPVNEHPHPVPDATSVCTTGSGGAVVLPPTAVRYHAHPGANVSR